MKVKFLEENNYFIFHFPADFPWKKTCISRCRIGKQFPALAELTEAMLFQGLAPSTRNTYHGHVEHYEEWCRVMGVKPWPLRWWRLGYYFTDRARFVSHETLRVGMNALASESQDRGYGNKFSKNESLDRIMRGIRRTYEAGHDGIEPLTIELLEALEKLWKDEGELEKRILTAAWTGVFTLSRTAELLSKEKSRPGRQAIRVKDVREETWGVNWPIIGGKTALRGEVKWVPIPFFQRRRAHCVAKRLLALKAQRLATSGREALFFTLPNGKPMTSTDFIAKIREGFKELGLDPKTFSGKSLRRGGATALLQRGATYREIRLAGRWKSNSVFRYTRLPVTERLRLAQRMEDDIDPTLEHQPRRNVAPARVYDDLKPPFGRRTNSVAKVAQKLAEIEAKRAKKMKRSNFPAKIRKKSKGCKRKFKAKKVTKKTKKNQKKAKRLVQSQLQRYQMLREKTRF